MRAFVAYDGAVVNSPKSSGWFLKRVLIKGGVLLGVAIVLTWGAKRWGPAPTAPVAPAAPGEAVSVAVHLPGAEHHTWLGLPYTPKMTVLDAMNEAKGRPHPLAFTVTGSGDTAFVTALEGIANQSGVGGGGGAAGGVGGAGGGGGAAPCWQFWINTRFATVGVGAAILKPGDRVTWVFEPYSDNPKPPAP